MIKTALELFTLLFLSKIIILYNNNYLFLIYSIVRPICLYGIQAAKHQNPAIYLPSLNSLCLYWYVTNKKFHKDLNLQTLKDLAKSHYIKLYKSSKLSSATHIQKVKKSMAQGPAKSI